VVVRRALELFSERGDAARSVVSRHPFPSPIKVQVVYQLLFDIDVGVKSSSPLRSDVLMDLGADGCSNGPCAEFTGASCLGVPYLIVSRVAKYHPICNDWGVVNARGLMTAFDVYSLQNTSRVTAEQGSKTLGSHAIFLLPSQRLPEEAVDQGFPTWFLLSPTVPAWFW